MVVFQVSPEETDALYDKVKDLPGLPEYKGPDGRAFFDKSIRDSVCVVVLPFGYCRLTDFVPGVSVQAHGMFWSREVLESLDVLRSSVDFVMGALAVNRVDVIVPEHKRSIRKLVERIGFKKDRRLNGYKNDGRIPIEAILYSIRRKG